MGMLFESVVNYLTEDNWRFNIVQEDTTLVLNFRGQSGTWQCLANVDEERQWFSFFSILPSQILPEKRSDISEFITRANYGLVIGNFEMDFKDGEVRFKTSIDMEGGELTPKMIDNLLRANLLTMDRYFPAFMRVLYADVRPATAVEDVERPRQERVERDEDFGYDFEKREGTNGEGE